MTKIEFLKSIDESEPPKELSAALQAMFWAKKGEWEKSHNLAQDDASKDGSWIHAYLHRWEGDQWNAEYWYRKAGQEVFMGSLEDEWDFIVASLLA